MVFELEKKEDIAAVFLDIGVELISIPNA